MEQNLLIDELQPEMVQASTGKRVLNSIIDTIGVYLFGAIIGIILVIAYPNSFMESANSADEAFYEFVWFFSFYALFFVYYFIFEYFTSGRSLGKLITGTRVVMEDGSKMDISTALKRNAIRLIPFEVFSAFGSPSYPWHDKWSNTYVMDIKKSNLSL